VDIALVFQKLGIALGLGLLVGLQRERVASPLAGIRTFALITVFGAVCALIGQHFGSWIPAMGGLAIAALLVTGNLVQTRAKRVDPGLTTEVAALLMYGVGVYIVVGYVAVAVALGGGVAMLLYFKSPLHAFVARIGEIELKAIMQFALIALVIFPILPDRTFGPYSVFNPHETWLMVVLIVGINLGGYVAYRVFGRDAGIILGGILGGLVSSTATTVSYSRRSRADVQLSRASAVVIMVASTISYVRILAELAAVAPGALRTMAPPLGVMLGWMVLLSGAVYWLSRTEKTDDIPHGNPAEWKSALVFGGLYALIIFGIAAVKHHFGQSWLFGIAILSGLHDVDAITLSTAQLVDHQRIDVTTAWRLILTASLSNIVAKGTIAALLGSRKLAIWIAIVFAFALAGGLLVIFLWPGADASMPSLPETAN